MKAFCLVVVALIILAVLFSSIEERLEMAVSISEVEDAREMWNEEA